MRLPRLPYLVALRPAGESMVKRQRTAAMLATALLALGGTLLAAAPAQAQLGDLMKQGGAALGQGGSSGNAGSAGGLGSSLGNLGGLGGALGGQSLASGSMGNVAGLLEFCIKNNYLGGGASGIKDQLMSKLGGGQAAKSDSDYKAGGMGLLKGSDGKQIDLSGGGMKEKVTRQVCDKVLSQGKSFL